MPKAPFGARAWRRPVDGSILPRIMRVPAEFTVPGPFGREIGQLADAMTRRTRDCSPDAMGVVPKRGRDHAHRHLHEKVPRLTGSRLRPGGRPGWETPSPAAHTSHVADDPGTGSAHHGTTDRPRTPAPARDRRGRSGPVHDQWPWGGQWPDGIALDAAGAV